MDWKKLIWFVPLLFLPKLAPAGVDPYRSYRGQLTLPRGIRNNNPGNIERTGTKWQGMALTQDDGRFITFKSWVWGVRAMVKTLRTYYYTHGLTTPRGIANRWAPASDGNNPENYARYIGTVMGIGPGDTFAWSQTNVANLVRAMLEMENGKTFSHYLTATDVAEAWKLA